MSIAPQIQAHRILNPPCASLTDTTAREPEHLIRIAGSAIDLLLAFSLLYREYLRAGYTRENQGELLFARHHLLPGTAVFLAKAPRDLLATATVVTDSEAFGLPMDDLFGAELAKLRGQGRTMVEVCSLASDGRKFARDGMQAFTRLLFLYCLSLGVDDVCIMVNPKHVPLYRDRCRFEVLGRERHYSRVNAPAVALRSDIRAIRERVPSPCAHPTLRQQADFICRKGKCRLGPEISLVLDGEDAVKPHNPLDERLLGILMNERADIIRNLPRPFIERASAIYPGLALRPPV